MNIDIKINKEAAFYYWIQAVAQWDVPPAEKKSYDFYADAFNRTATEKEKIVVASIKEILINSNDPRMILAELYTNKPKKKDAFEIQDKATTLLHHFEPIWSESLPVLRFWSNEIKKNNLNLLRKDLNEVSNFLSSTFELNERLALYLLPNIPNGDSLGHMINGTSFLLLHPAWHEKSTAGATTFNTILHEYIHAIEFASKIDSILFKKSYETIIAPEQLSSPPGYTWNMIFRETIVYVFANNITGGYFKPKIFQTPKPTIEEMKDGFEKIVKEHRHTTSHVIAWVALNIQNDVMQYINEKKVIDNVISNKISKLFRDFYLTNKS